MKKILTILILAMLFMTTIAFAEECNPDLSELDNMNEFDLAKIPGASALVGNKKIVKLAIDESEYYFFVQGGKASKAEATEEINYILSTDKCTVQRIKEGSDPMDEFDSKNITLKGVTFGAKIKTGIGKAILKVWSWFR